MIRDATTTVPEATGVELESVACASCGATDARTVLITRDLMFQSTDREFQFVECRRCGLTYLNPRPAAGSIDRFYPDDYAPFKRRGVTRRVREWQYHRSARDLWPLLAPPGKVVDVGCGAGELLAAIRQAGNSNVLGVEPSARASATARDVRRLPVVTGTLESARLDDGSVDAVLMSHVIEHLPDPGATLDEIRRVLSPQGALILWLPNVDSVPANVLGRYWMGWDAPRHFYAFTPDTLRRLLTERGFVVQETFHERHGIEWSWGLRLWARERIRSTLVDATLAALHPVIGIGATPLAAATALLGRSGRIRVIARPNLR